MAELTSAASDRLQSPVLDVGDRVIDGVPNSIKTLAIDWFGTNDKLALLTGIGVVLGLYAAALGVVALTRFWRLAIAGAAAFGLIGAYASQSSRRPAPWWAVAPSIAGGLVAAIALLALRALLGRDSLAWRAYDTPTAAAVDEELAARSTVVASCWRPAPPRPRVGDRHDRACTGDPIRRRRPTRALRLPRRGVPCRRSQPQPQASPGHSPFVTPNADFYRIDTKLTVPRRRSNRALAVTGMVTRPPALVRRSGREIVEADVTLTCVSNEVGGKLIGNARWLRRLDDLLDEAGIEPAADQIVGRSVDGYTCGFPVSALDGRHALVAIGMNGEPLPLEHGYPAL